jgi:hypothetical protein
MLCSPTLPHDLLDLILDPYRATLPANSYHDSMRPANSFEQKNMFNKQKPLAQFEE